MINANKDYLKSFFQTNIQYIVPFFQRSYVWDSENWEILWENINQVYSEYKKNENQEHFIGTLIIKQRQAEKIGENKYDLIDGQQRLTTISLLLKAMSDSCNNELPKLKIKLDELVVFEDTKENKFIRILPSRLDKPYFESIMFGNGTNGLDQNHKIFRAYQFFLNKVKDFSDYEKDELKDIILNKVPIISMMLSADDDEQVIFDTINSLGVKLTTAELLKNYIFKEDELQNLYEKLWQTTFEQDDEQMSFWNKDKTSGRIIRTNIEVLLYCYLIILTQEEVKLERLFNEYKKWLTNKTVNDKKGFLISLKNYAESYYTLPEGNELNEISFSEGEKVFFHIIENISVTTAYPLILYIYNKVSDFNERLKFLKILESYLVRRNVCRLTTKNYNNLFISILQKLKNIESENSYFSIDDFKSILYSFAEETNLFPDDIKFKNAFLSSELSNQNAREILFCISLYQKSSDLSDVQKLCSSSFSVEHIMPKQWQQNWAEKQINEAEILKRDRAVLKLGNLTLITKRLNSKLKNSSWIEKKRILKEYSSLKITADYLDLVQWDESTINTRALNLYEISLKIWKR